ncbi:hypothetical protein QYF36_000099 [Acer negundo]|nr:hypothetical protein QYF36_000099 [Acer negundo]
MKEKAVEIAAKKLSEAIKGSKKVEIVSIDKTGSVSLAESRRGHGGVQVGLVLDKNEMDLLLLSSINASKVFNKTTLVKLSEFLLGFRH